MTKNLTITSQDQTKVGHKTHFMLIIPTQPKKSWTRRFYIFLYYYSTYSPSAKSYSLFSIRAELSFKQKKLLFPLNLIKTWISHKNNEKFSPILILDG